MTFYRVRSSSINLKQRAAPPDDVTQRGATRLCEANGVVHRATASSARRHQKAASRSWSIGLGFVFCPSPRPRGDIASLGVIFRHVTLMADGRHPRSTFLGKWVFHPEKKQFLSGFSGNSASFPRDIICFGGHFCNPSERQRLVL